MKYKFELTCPYCKNKFIEKFEEDYKYRDNDDLVFKCYDCETEFLVYFDTLENLAKKKKKVRVHKKQEKLF